MNEQILYKIDKTSHHKTSVYNQNIYNFNETTNIKPFHHTKQYHLDQKPHFYPELKNNPIQQTCKKQLLNSVYNLLKIQKEKNHKVLIHPCEERNKFNQLYKWLVTRLEYLQTVDCYQTLNIKQYLQQHKKLLISGYIQLCSLINQQCQQKSSILKILFTTSLQIINTLVIQMQNNIQNAIFKQAQQKLRTQSELLKKIEQLMRQNDQLKKQKNHKWKNLYMVIKDNRVVRKQKNKLLKQLKQQQWKVKLINQQHLKLKQQYQKYKLIISQLQNVQSKSEQQKRITDYVNTKIKVDQIDRYIKLYPKKVQKIVTNQLKKIEIQEISTLHQKMAFILKAIENAGEMVEDFDQIQDFLNTNKVKMFFNISTQTQIITKQTAINTNQKTLTNYFTQVELTKLSQKFKYQPMNINEKIKPTQINMVRGQRKGKTVNIAISQKLGLNKSNRKIGSIKRLLMEDGDLSQGFQLTSSVQVKYPADFPTKRNKYYIKKRQSTSSESDSNPTNNQNQSSKILTNNELSSKVRFDDNFPNKKNRGTFDSQSKGQQKIKINSRNKQKRQSRVQNMHTFSSKCKMRQTRAQQQDWKIIKLYAFSANDEPQQINNFTFDKLNKKSKKRITVKIPSFNSNNYLTGNLLTRWKPKLTQQSLSNEQQQILGKLATNRNISELVSNKDIFGAIKLAQNLKQYDDKQQAFQNDKQNQQIPKGISGKLIKRQQLSRLGAKNGSHSKDLLNKVNSLKRQSKQSINTVTTQGYAEKRLLTQQTSNTSQNSVPAKMKDKNSPKRLSQMPAPMSSLNLFKAKKHNRQISFISNGAEGVNPHFQKFIKKRTSQVSLHSFGNQKFTIKKHYRTKTQGIQQIQQTAQQVICTSKNIPDKALQKAFKNKGQKLQTQFLESTFSPKKKYNISTISDFQKIDNKNEDQEGQNQISFDLNKNIDKIVKNIAQRSSQIIKKQYLFKQFLISFYQQQYGGTGNMKTCLQIIQQIKNRRHSNSPVVNCFNLLMNQSCSEIYRKDIFKLFAVVIDKNGGSLNNNSGGHTHYKKILSQILQIFIEQKQVKIIINGLCIQVLNGSLPDYFIAGQMQIRKRSLKTQLYRFLSEQILPPSQTLVSFQLIKQLTYFLSVNNIKVKNKLMQVRVYSQPNIQLHRLCLICQKLVFKELSEIQFTVQKKYQQFSEMSGAQFDQQKIIDLLAKQNFTGFPYLKQILHKQIQNFYKYNITISRILLKLCHLTVFELKMQNQFPLSNNLKIINQKSQKVERLCFYQQLVKKNHQQKDVQRKSQ